MSDEKGAGSGDAGGGMSSQFATNDRHWETKDYKRRWPQDREGEVAQRSGSEEDAEDEEEGR